MEIISLLAIVGLVVVSDYVLRFVWELVKELIPLGRSLHKYGQQEGHWAVVTGGTDGIGLGFCEVLAGLGWNLCIVSRNQAKMRAVIDRLKEQLKKANKKVPQFMYIVADFKNGTNPQFFEGIASKLAHTKIGLLVNNVGTADIKNYQQYSLQQIINTININCMSMAALTRVLLPNLTQSPTTKSAIINLSSFLGENPAPYSTVYAATKAFNTLFSESLGMEAKMAQVDILSAKPMFVESPLSKKKKGFLVPDRRQCAWGCLKELRWDYETYGHFSHRLAGLLVRVLPKWIRRPAFKASAQQARVSYHNE